MLTKKAVFKMSGLLVSIFCFSCGSSAHHSRFMQGKRNKTEKTQTPFIAIGHVTVKPGKEDAFRKKLPKLIKASRQEEGNRRYYFFQSLSSPTNFATVESWDNQEAMQIHLESKHVKKFIAAVEGLLTAPPTLKTYQAASDMESDVRLQEIAETPDLLYLQIHVSTNDGGAVFAPAVIEEIKITRENEKDSNLLDEAYRSSADDGQFAVFNIWKDEKALADHLQQPYAKEFLEKIKPTLVAPPTIESYKLIL